MEFTLPAKFNGIAFNLECLDNNIKLEATPRIENGVLILESKAKAEDLQKILDAHLGDESPTLLRKIQARESAKSKLIDLGLTEDEIAAL